jgi:hypothetical protein
LAGGDPGGPLGARGRTPISAPWRADSSRRSRGRSDVRPPRSRTGRASKSCWTTRPPIAWPAPSAPTWGRCDGACTDAGRQPFPRGTPAAVGHAQSPALSPALSCRTTGGPRPRQRWGFEASVIPTTRPPRGRSGSRDHTLAQLSEAGAGAGEAEAMTEHEGLTWTSDLRRTVI